MYKEIVITIIIVALIIVGNIITQNNTNKATEELNTSLETLKKEISSETVNEQNAKKNMEEVKKTWKEQYEPLAFYIEHNELEKVETEISKMEADIENKEYTMAGEALSNCVFILEHIKDKMALKIINIF